MTKLELSHVHVWYRLFSTVYFSTDRLFSTTFLRLSSIFSFALRYRSVLQEQIRENERKKELERLKEEEWNRRHGFDQVKC